MIRAFAATEAGGPLARQDYDPGPLGADQVEIDVLACGICHSDLSMLDNDWGMTTYPLVPGHEVVGTVAAVGKNVRSISVGETVGLGWYSGSCLTCPQCMGGDHNLCGSGEQTIVGRHGGFADKVRCKAEWAIPLPAGLNVTKAGPLFCGGITVFNPIVQFGVKPTDRVGVIGIGGLGHLA
ncbi:MAG: alcohol dehydrogenase catalytic domain-containing protein, partial [Acidobacteria bacterium]|nr:alcohol dehydrogenase catalytic domain-containing protein [Acidobacteriota bacterium]